MKKLLLLLTLLSTVALGADKPVSCLGASCKVIFETRNGSNVKVSAGNIDATGKLNLLQGLGVTGTISSSGGISGSSATFPILYNADNTSSRMGWITGGSNNALDIPFQDSGGTNNSDRWAALMNIFLHGDATNASSRLVYVVAYGTTGIATTILGASTPAGDPAFSITRPSSNILRFNSNGFGTIKRIYIIWESRSF